MIRLTTLGEERREYRDESHELLQKEANGSNGFFQNGRPRCSTPTGPNIFQHVQLTQNSG